MKLRNLLMVAMLGVIGCDDACGDLSVDQPQDKDASVTACEDSCASWCEIQVQEVPPAYRAMDLEECIHGCVTNCPGHNGVPHSDPAPDVG